MAEDLSIAIIEVEIVRPGAAPISGCLAKPEVVDRAPGVLVIHEAAGLNENIRGIAGRFARAGYVALAVDLFAGGNRALCMLRVMGEPFLRPLDNSGLRTLRSSIDWLQLRPEVDAARIGVIGFCMGGSYALMLACVEDDLKAASTFYGNNPRPLSAVAEACPIVGSYGSKDPFTRRAATDRLKSRSRFSLAAMKSMMSG